MMQSVAELKNKVINSPNLNNVIHYLFDLMDAGILSRTGPYLTENEIEMNAEIQTVLSSITKTTCDFLQKNTSLNHALLTYVQEENLYHGIVHMNATAFPIPVIYFQDIQTCVFCVASSSTSADCFRFSLIEASALHSPH